MSRAGRKSFDNCSVKRVEFVDFVAEEGVFGKSIPSLNITVDSRSSRGTSATLMCPRTEVEGVSLEANYNKVNTRDDSYKEVRQRAGEILCRNCEFSGMTPTEVSIAQTEYAKAETDRIEAFKALEAAREEIKSIENRGFTG